MIIQLQWQQFSGFTYYKITFFSKILIIIFRTSDKLIPIEDLESILSNQSNCSLCEV